MNLILLLQTSYDSLPPNDAALTQALETTLYTPEDMPIDRSHAGLASGGSYKSPFKVKANQHTLASLSESCLTMLHNETDQT